MSTTSTASRVRPSLQAAAATSKAAPPLGTTHPTGQLRQRMQQDLQLAGLSQGTQRVYLRAVRQLAAHYKISPDQLSEAQLREYLLFLKNDKQWAASSLRTAYCAIKFFYARTAPRDWQTLRSLRIPQP